MSSGQVRGWGCLFVSLAALGPIPFAIFVTVEAAAKKERVELRHNARAAARQEAIKLATAELKDEDRETLAALSDARDELAEIKSRLDRITKENKGKERRLGPDFSRLKRFELGHSSLARALYDDDVSLEVYVKRAAQEALSGVEGYKSVGVNKKQRGYSLSVGLRPGVNVWTKEAAALSQAILSLKETLEGGWITQVVVRQGPKNCDLGPLLSMRRASSKLKAAFGRRPPNTNLPGFPGMPGLGSMPVRIGGNNSVWLVKNDTPYQLKITLRGRVTRTLSIPSGGTHRETVPPGTYSVHVTSSSGRLNPLSSTRTFRAGYEYPDGFRTSNRFGFPR
jgi:hypothetical protein